MVMSRNVTLGGRNEARLQKSTTQAGESTIGSLQTVADKVTKSDMIDSGARQDHTPIVLEIDL